MDLNDYIEKVLWAKFRKGPKVDLGDFTLLNEPMPDLVPRKRKIWGLGKPLGGCTICELDEYNPFFDTDGNLLVMPAMYHRDLFYLMRYIGGTCLVVSAISLIGCLLFALGGTFEAFEKSMLFATVWILLLGILIYFSSNSLVKTGYIVFDREHGTVMLPVKNQGRRWVVPFDDIKCYGVTRFYKSGFLYHTFLHSLSKPIGARDFKQEVKFGFYSTRQGAQASWQIIENFMDKSLPIPDVFPLHERIAWFKKRNTSIAEYYKHPRPYDYPMETIDPAPDAANDEEFTRAG